jgi:hypothetical protein
VAVLYGLAFAAELESERAGQAQPARDGDETTRREGDGVRAEAQSGVIKT